MDWSKPTTQMANFNPGMKGHQALFKQANKKLVKSLPLGNY